MRSWQKLVEDEQNCKIYVKNVKSSIICNLNDLLHPRWPLMATDSYDRPPGIYFRHVIKYLALRDQKMSKLVRFGLISKIAHI